MEQHEHVQRLWRKFIKFQHHELMWRWIGNIQNQNFEKYKNAWNGPIGEHWYKHMYRLGTPNKLKSMIYQMKKKHDRMKDMKKWNHQWMILVYK